MRKKFEDKSTEEKRKYFTKLSRYQRLKLAKNQGFNTLEELKVSLFTETEPCDKKDVIIASIDVIDCSSSMYNKLSTVKKGLLEDDSEVDEKFILPFSSTVGSLMVSNNTNINFLKPRGSTALNDAIVKSVEHGTKLIADKVLIKVFTDGGENSSGYNIADVYQSLSYAADNGITVVFAGTELDMRKIVTKYSVDESNIIVHDNTNASIQKVMEENTKSTKLYTKKVIAGEDTLTGFYKKGGTL